MIYIIEEDNNFKISFYNIQMLGELIIFSTISAVLFIILILAKIWDRLCDFFHMHYTYFKILFVTLYFLEQSVFIGASYLYREKPLFYPAVVGLFALVVLTTVTFQGIMMESINKKSSDKLNKYNEESSNERFKMKQKYENQINNLRGYIGHLENENELLNNILFENNKRVKSKK